MIWGGTGERCCSSRRTGGEQLRQRIRALLRGDPSPTHASPLAFKGETVIQARGADLAVQIDHWAVPAADLLSYAWDASLRHPDLMWLPPTATMPCRVGGLAVGGTHPADRPAPVILTGILPGPSGDRAWCRVVEFAEEFGISVSYDPLVLGERRGGRALDGLSPQQPFPGGPAPRLSLILLVVG